MSVYILLSKSKSEMCDPSSGTIWGGCNNSGKLSLSSEEDSILNKSQSLCVETNNNEKGFRNGCKQKLFGKRSKLRGPLRKALVSRGLNVNETQRIKSE